jgi:hypothetical protein
MNEAKIREIISKYVPAAAVSEVVRWIIHYKIHLKITARRKSILGNYRSPRAEEGHRISVNSDLNAFAFLLTFTHEVAHLVTWEKYKNTVKPHGVEWKNAYKHLMQTWRERAIFPHDLQVAIDAYMQDPAASSCSDSRLLRALRLHDEGKSGILHLEEIQPDAIFQIEDGRMFRKGQRLRKNFLCVELQSRRTYKINGMMRVTPVANSQQG